MSWTTNFICPNKRRKSSSRCNENNYNGYRTVHANCEFLKIYTLLISYKCYYRSFLSCHCYIIFFPVRLLWTAKIMAKVQHTCSHCNYYTVQWLGDWLWTRHVCTQIFVKIWCCCSRINHYHNLNWDMFKVWSAHYIFPHKRHKSPSHCNQNNCNG